MCMRCDGYSWEEIERRTDLMIRIHGFTTIHVEAESPWTYTLGAYESWDQPELLIVDIDAATQSAEALALKVTHPLLHDYVDLGEIQPATLDLLDVELIAVDASFFHDGLVAAWESRYNLSAVTGDFVQIVPGPSWFCETCVDRVRRLDAP